MKKKGRKVGKGSKEPAKPPRSNPPVRDTQSDGLTARQARFVELFLESGNATQAAIGAGYSAARADVEGSELQRHPVVAAEIARRQRALNKRLEIKQERVLEETAALAFSDITEILEDTPGEESVPRIKPVSKWSARARRSIKSVKVKRYEAVTDKDGNVITEPFDIIEFGLWDKPAALERLWKRLDLEGPKGNELEGLTDAERIAKIAEILSRGRARKASAA